MSGPIRLAEAVGAIACGHIASSCIGMGAAVAAQPPPPPTSSGSTSNNACATCSKEAQLTKVVSKMYCGGGLDAAACIPGVTFTDAAVHCAGRAEVSEAFRALHVVKPEHVEQPHAVGKPDGSTEIHLWQRYLRGSLLLPNGFTLRSVLVVRTNADGRICELQELWNGSPLLQLTVFQWSRRANGVLSSLLTPIVVERSE